MLSICSEFAIDMDIIFNDKKSICIKRDDSHMLEEAVVNYISLSWSNQDTLLFYYKLIEKTYFIANKGTFINSVYININIHKYNFIYIQPCIMGNLFKTYCCSFNGSQTWKCQSNYFSACCTSWNNISEKKMFC